MTAGHQPGLRTKVGRKLVGILLGCAVVPLLVLAGLTIRQTGAELDNRARSRLQYEARSVTQEALGRLSRLANVLETAVRSVDEAGGVADPSVFSLAVTMAPSVTDMVVQRGPDLVVPIVGRLEVPTLGAGERRQLDDWGQLILPDPKTPGRFLLIVGSGLDTSTRAAARVDPAWVSGVDRPDDLPPESDVCVVPDGIAPVCSNEKFAASARAALAQGSGAAHTSDADGTPYLTWVSFISLDAMYGAPSWPLFISRPRALVQGPLDQFAWLVGMVVLGASLAVALIGMALVRRRMQPLEVLTAATRRLAARDFDHPVEITSDDEFQTLGNAFNQLRTDLQAQFGALEAFSAGTLTTLARAIDAKSHWTAGHSERVTDVALRIADAMGATRTERQEIRTGALVHDIGKLATPAELLDKADRLTDEEERIVRRHPAQGVHILEPIPAFRSILSIVGEHHERWDGAGYPKGLAGDAISRTARIVAVADVYDALRSSRPYRDGLPHAAVVDVIRRGAGRHFDPAVVAAFLRIAGALGAAAIDDGRRPLETTPEASAGQGGYAA